MKTPIINLFEKYYGIYGIPAFNVFTAEQIKGIFQGAQEASLPIIIAITPVARNYMSHNLLEGMIKAASNLFPTVEFSVHLDHGNYEHCLSAIESGFYDSVMIDASHEDFDKNISITSEIVKRAHDKGIAVEAELGVLSGVEDDISVSELNSRFTNPNQVKEFVDKTNCDSLAVAIGTSHGAYKMKNIAGLQLDILKQIQDLLGKYPIVLHGASNVPMDEVIRINKNGGNLEANAKGINIDEIRKAIQLGVCKINIATDLRLIWTRVHREFFNESPELFDPIIPGKKYINELESFVAAKCQSFCLDKDIHEILINEK
ncbi:MAG: class II fructose-bisphosphate aldolase [Bacteroidetes bacterium]|nr:class II fructose-bisphosphate aldolase [Bacteroidota bacterium]MBU1116942.1 class II fructose-bisphosphate aldolase [Bacteroidota bacterium]MBU1799115.1 class II fructose-bisphosphate aldolase [Bacteroidota bacterium]